MCLMCGYGSACVVCMCAVHVWWSEDDLRVCMCGGQRMTLRVCMCGVHVCVGLHLWYACVVCMCGVSVGLHVWWSEGTVGTVTCGN